MSARLNRAAAPESIADVQIVFPESEAVFLVGDDVVVVLRLVLVFCCPETGASTSAWQTPS